MVKTLISSGCYKSVAAPIEADSNDVCFWPEVVMQASMRWSDHQRLELRQRPDVVGHPVIDTVSKLNADEAQKFRISGA
jgi:hypothetical protein